jgi:HPt (histidine-containing phosphotransfer) domain-containing protein
MSRTAVNITAQPVPADLTPASLDAEVIGRLARLGETVGQDLLGQVSALFLADADIQLGALRQAIEQFDPGAVIRIAHTIRGASSNLGATKLGELCTVLELAAERGELSDAGPLLVAVTTELARVRAALISPPVSQ